MFKSKSKAPSKDSGENFKDFLVNDLPDSIVIVSQDLSKCLFSNQSFSTLLNISSPSDIKSRLEECSLHQDEEAKYKSEPSLKTLWDFVQYALNHADFSTGKKFSCIFIYKADEPLVFEAKVFKKVWDNTPAVSIILHDMTEHYTKMNIKIDEAERSSTSHEFRTPLYGILGIVDLMKRITTDVELVEYLDICRSDARRLLSLINSSLDLTQIRHNKLILCNTRFNLSEVLNDTVGLFKFQCNQKNLSLNLDVSPSTPKYLKTDKSRLSQILIHLVSNAIKFTYEGGISIAVKPSEDKRYIKLTVKDTGIGLRDNEREHLENMLSGSFIKRHVFGLGLDISQSLAKLLGGEEHKAGLSIESTHQKGAAFSFWIKTTIDEGEKGDEDVTQTEYDEDNEGNDKNDIDEIMEQHTMVKNPARF